MAECCPKGTRQLSGVETESDSSTSQHHPNRSAQDYKIAQKLNSQTRILILYMQSAVINSVQCAKEYKPMAHCCHGDRQVTSNRNAYFYSPDDRVHAGRVCKLWRGVGC